MALSDTQNTVRFGPFELDLRTQQVSKNGANIRLSQQPVQVLSLLLETPGEIVTREEFRRRLWPSDVFVDFDHGLNKSIQKCATHWGIRQSLRITSKPSRGSGTASLRSPIRREELWSCRQRRASLSRRLLRPCRQTHATPQTEESDGF